MAANGGHVNVASDSHEEHDHVEYRKRVATWVDGDTASYETEDFTEGDSPAVIDFFTDSGRIGHAGFIVNDGPGDILVELSKDGTSYGGQMALHGGETFDLTGLNFKKIRLTYVDPSSYRSMLG